MNAEEAAVLLEQEQMRDWLVAQRWFASKSRSVSAVEALERLELPGGLMLTLANARFATGTHELYQLLLYSDSVWSGAEPIATAGSSGLFDLMCAPGRALALLALIDAGREFQTEAGAFHFRCAEAASGIGEDASARALRAEQSNSSIVLGERLIFKLYRKLESGINPELEMLRFLSARGFENLAGLHGWYEYEGTSLAATLGLAQEFIADGHDGWELALQEIASAPERFLERLGSLGDVTAQMHNVLASDDRDPAFSPEEPSQESLALLTATIDEDIERVFTALPADERLAPIAGRGEDVRERLASRAHIGSLGRQIRNHGDYHLGQTLWGPRGWLIIDFEGEPARALPERRAKRSPLRDVASMLRSFAYAASAVQRADGGEVPAEFEQRARERFLEHYLATVDSALLPGGDGPTHNLLAVFELEKAVYELRYELDNRPDWVGIPAAGIARLLEDEL
jgi:maltokinase